ncbi:MAG: TonB family protein [Myxococcota bacterium]|nr:TonB family protein [Myxococcota bacterium]
MTATVRSKTKPQRLEFDLGRGLAHVPALLTLLCMIGSQLISPTPGWGQTSGDDIRLPRPLHTPLAIYPESARTAELEGDVTLRLSLDVTGHVTAARVVQSAGRDFDEAAKAAAMCFRFAPAERAGQAVEVTILYKYPFRLRDADRRGKCQEDESWRDGDPVLLPGALTGRLEGLLLERGARRPLRGVEVRIPALKVRQLTDENGRFRFNKLPVGPLTFEVLDQEFKPLREVHEIKEEGGNELLRLYLERQRFAGEDLLGREYQLLNQRVRLGRSDVANRYPLARTEIQGIAGIDGDIIQAVRSLPGVGRPAFAMGPLLLRGSAPEIYLFDTPLSAPSHLMGLRSRLPSALLEGVELETLSGAARRGGGAALTLRLREPPRERLTGEFELNPFESGFMVGGPLTLKSTLTAGLRRGVASELAQLFAGESRFVQHGPALPESYDSFIRYTWRDGSDQIDTLFSFYQSDWSREQGAAPRFPARRGTLYGERLGVQGQGRWQHRYSDRLSSELTFSLSHQDDEQRPAYDQYEKVSRSAFELHPIFHYAFTRHLLSFGLDGGHYMLDDQQENLGPRVEGDGAIERRSPLRLSGGENRSWQDAALWVDGKLQWTDLRLIPGLRLSYFGDSESFHVEPRLTLRYRPAFGTILKLAGGQYSERLDPRLLDPQRGNPALQPGQSIRTVLGVEQQLTERLSLDISGSWRRSEGLVQINSDPRIRFTDEAELQVIGAEFLLRHELSDRFYGWLSYSYSHIELLPSPEAALRRADWEQNHLISLIGQFRFTPRLATSLRWSYGSPLSYSSSAGSIFDSDRGQPSAFVGAVNDQLLDPHHQLDLRLDYRFLFDQAELLTYIDVKNVYYQRGVEAVDPSAWRFDTVEGVQQLPLLITLGLRGAF